MNAGIVMLRDGTPCIVYDEQLPHLINHVEFSREDYQITLIYKLPDNLPKMGKKFEFPLDHPFVKLLEKKKKIAVACVQNGDLFEIKMYSVVFSPLKK
jgi:hypothetical protein